MSSKSKQILCDKNGRPIPPSDASPTIGLRRGIVLLALGVVLLPLGLVLLNVVYLGDNLGAVTFLFYLIIFFGTFFILAGVAMIILASVQLRKMPPRAEQIRDVIERGEVCKATVTSVSTRRTKEGAEYKLYLEYFDRDYRFKRRFVSDYTAVKYRAGETVTVHYYPDSNLGYYVETE